MQNNAKKMTKEGDINNSKGDDSKSETSSASATTSKGDKSQDGMKWHSFHLI